MIYTLLLAAIMLPYTGIAQKTVTAQSVIASINSHAPVNLSGVEITGDLDLTKLDNMKLESKNASDKVYISTVTSPVSFTNCKFSGKVLGYNNPDWNNPLSKNNAVYNTNFTAAVNFGDCIFEKMVSFKYSVFEDQLSFTGSKFNDEAEFKYTKFEEGPKFTSVIFTGSTVFKYVEFPAGFDFSHVNFESRPDFKYAQFNKGGSFAAANFKSGSDFKYAGFSKSVNLKGASFNGSNDFKYTTLDNEKTTISELVSK